MSLYDNGESLYRNDEPCKPNQSIKADIIDYADDEQAIRVEDHPQFLPGCISVTDLTTNEE